MSPGKIDSTLVSRHLTALDAAIQQLAKHRGRAEDLLLTDRDEAWIVERGLQLCCQNALDLALHLAASRGREANDYTQAIDALGELGIVPTEFVRAFRGIGGFRNALVHGYLGVQTKVLHQVLNERLSEFEQFAQHVERYLDLHGG